MPNMLDYIAWRGDLTFQTDPLNENDTVILSQLSYVAFGPYAEGPDGAPVPLREAVAALLLHDPRGEVIHQTSYLWSNNVLLLKALAESRRFGSLQLFGAVDSFSGEDEKQFAAISVLLPDGGTCLCFRGTDDTVIGWKEDLNMSFESPVPAQREAEAYLKRIAGETAGPLYLMGHSKGGNLAMYAASRAEEEVSARIAWVVNHDGPGLDAATVRSDGYQRMREKLSVYIPFFSIFGMLMEHEEHYTVVQSSGKRILQHDAFTWLMQGTEMLRAEQLSEECRNVNRIIKDWLETLDQAQRKVFVEAVYAIASANGENIDIDIKWPVGAQKAVAAIRAMQPDIRATFYRVIAIFFSRVIRGIRLPWVKEEEA